MTSTIPGIQREILAQFMLSLKLLDQFRHVDPAATGWSNQKSPKELLKAPQSIEASRAMVL
ncbi:uncharacterized protein N7482_010754 [Penicillium canariense]|uniref:Uncharacterized protein n=1 Tax=Penicillium canariense TaxID=189055 RepID=A0A9W9HL85_9EURO|nr:uncharacterized protein N7482_010754 [Penicillium canariense]KAJ5151502.1 hypothetical protein N7482_010754 [Penicillium canariense]